MQGGVQPILIAFNQIDFRAAVAPHRVGITVPVVPCSRRRGGRRHGCHVKGGIAPATRSIQINRHVDAFSQEVDKFKIGPFAGRVRKVGGGHEVGPCPIVHLDPGALLHDRYARALWGQVTGDGTAIFPDGKSVFLWR